MYFDGVIDRGIQDKCLYGYNMYNIVVVEKQFTHVINIVPMRSHGELLVSNTLARNIMSAEIKHICNKDTIDIV
jgi:hypothetical protein